MDAIELNAALYAKMEAEMTDFANWLLKQPPEVILNHAIEYATKFDIVSIMETTDLSEEKARALLSLEEPLDAIYKDYGESSSNSLDVLVSFIEDKADELLSTNQANAAVQVYPYSGEVAEREGDLEWYRQSHKLNIACKNEIELRQLVQTGATQEFTDSGNAGVILQLEVFLPFCLLLRRKLVDHGIRISVHRAELQQRKRFSILAYTMMHINCRTWRFQFDQSDYDKHG